MRKPKYRAVEWDDERGHHFTVEAWDPEYGFPAVIVPKQPHFTTKKQAEEYAFKLTNGIESEQSILEEFGDGLY